MQFIQIFKIYILIYMLVVINMVLKIISTFGYTR